LGGGWARRIWFVSGGLRRRGELRSCRQGGEGRFSMSPFAVSLGRHDSSISMPAAVPEETQAWFRAEVQPHERMLRGYLRDKFPAMDTDDLVQESYLRLLKARARGQILSTKAYIFAVAINTARTLFHRQRIYSDVALANLPAAEIETNENATVSLDDEMRFQLAVAAIDELPPRCREIMKLAILDKLSAGQIAEQTGLAVNTVYAQMAIGVRKCGEFLRKKQERA